MNFIKNNTRILLFILATFLLSSCAKKIYTTISWQPTTVTVDGKPKEWEIPLRYYDDKSKLQFVYTNDSKNLYVCIRSTDNTVTNKILRAGMQVWIDTTGQKVESTGVMFPLIQHAGVKHSQGQSGGQTEQQTGQQSGQQTGSALSSQTAASDMVKNQHQMQLMGFRAPIGGFTPINNEFGIQAAMAVDSLGILFYELAVPFATFYHPLTAADTAKNFSIEIVINELQREGGNGGHSGSSGSGGGMRGGGGGGGMGGGMGGGGMRGGGGGGGMHGGGGNRNQDENSETNEKTSLWRYIKMAYK